MKTYVNIILVGPTSHKLEMPLFVNSIFFLFVSGTSNPTGLDKNLSVSIYFSEKIEY